MHTKNTQSENTISTYRAGHTHINGDVIDQKEKKDSKRLR